MTLRIVIADSQPVVRAGLFAFFQNTDVQIVDDAQNCAELVAKTLAALPDVLIADVAFPDGSCFDAVVELRSRGYLGRVLVLANDARQFELASARAAGVDSYLLKRTSRSELLTYVRALAQADANVDAYSGELQRVSSLMNRQRVEPFSPLTIRETQVLRCVALGLSNKEIALTMRLSVDSIKEHVQNIMRKLDVKNRTQAAVLGIREKLIP